jgi:hypothetical protein
MRHRAIITSVVVAAAALLGGCDRLQAAWAGFNAPSGSGEVAPPATPVVEVAGTPGSAGPAITPDSDDGAQTAASVVEVTPLAAVVGVDGKIYGQAGGDPAMNGLYVHLAIYRSPAEGWWVFPLGDFLNYRVVGQSKGRVDLELKESVMDEATSEIGDRTRRIAVLITPGPDEETTPTVRIAPVG